MESAKKEKRAYEYDVRVSINLLYDGTLYNVQCILHEKEWKKKKRNELEIIKIYTHRLVQARHIRQAAAHEYTYKYE